MRVSLIAFTAAGTALARRIAELLRASGDTACVSCPERLATTADLEAAGELDAWTERAFATSDALVYVSALGICVRAIAPHVTDKLTDPAVVCVDEGANHAIAVLSGHVGGANALSERIAHATGAEAIITTATDVRGVFAIDAWATERGLTLTEREAAKRVSATLLAGGTVGLVSEVELTGPVPAGLVADEAGEHEVGIQISDTTDAHPFACTCRLIPRTIRVGIGCKRGTAAHEIAEAVDRCLTEAHIAPEAVCGISTIDLKADEEGLRSFARERGLTVCYLSAEELSSVEGTFHHSDFVERMVGVDNVCERAACAGGGTLIAPKRAVGPVTVALAREGLTLDFGNSAQERTGWLAVVGLGPGAGASATVEAARTLDAADVIMGYATYVDLVADDYAHKELIRWPMRSEVRRANDALERARTGERVALVCSGDAGVYGMAGVVLELARVTDDIRVVAGVTAATAGAALLGAPLGHDWCCISLSDQLIDWSTIERRLAHAAEADLVICLYNVASHARPHHLRRAVEVLRAHKPGSCVCGIARAVGRAQESSLICTLDELAEAAVDMTTVVYVGSTHTRVVAGRMVTPRGYKGVEGGDSR